MANSASTVFSVDCMVRFGALKNENLGFFFIKLVFIFVTPVLIAVISTIVWICIYWKRKGLKQTFKNPEIKEEFKSKLTTTNVVILFLVHTTVF